MMESKNEGVLSFILKKISKLSPEEFSKAEKDIKKWNQLKKKLQKGSQKDKLLLKKILQQTNLK